MGLVPFHKVLLRSRDEILVRLNEVKDIQVQEELRTIAMRLEGAAFYLKQHEEDKK